MEEGEIDDVEIKPLDDHDPLNVGIRTVTHAGDTFCRCYDFVGR